MKIINKKNIAVLGILVFPAFLTVGSTYAANGEMGGFRGQKDEALAEFIGTTSDQVRELMESGKRLFEILSDNNKTITEFRTFMDQKLQEKIDSGEISAEKAAEIRARQAERESRHQELLEQLGLTEDEFQSALSSGKTLEELAAEKGVTLPERPMEGRGERGEMREQRREKLLQDLGMTAEELKAELDSGKTIKQIAEEKGVTLPEAPRGFGGRGGRGF